MIKRWTLKRSADCGSTPIQWGDRQLGCWAFISESEHNEPFVTEYPDECDYVRWDDHAEVVKRLAFYENQVVEKFESLANQWRRETLNSSSLAEIVFNDSYIQIIGLGPAVLPLIFRSLKERDDWWFSALRAITGVNPVIDCEEGNFAAMRNAWLRWADDLAVREKYGNLVSMEQC
jgi:hypothetical protein